MMTICGLKVSKFISSKRSGSRLHILTSKPSECRVCKHCERINAIGESELRLEQKKEIVTPAFEVPRLLRAEF
jgi:hypothetical protein